MHIKTTVRTTAGPLRWLGGESEKCWRGAERLEASYTVAQRNGAVTLEGSLAVPQKVRVIIWLCSSPFRCINKRNENYCSHRNPYTHVYSSILYHNRQKAGTTHRPSTWKADQSNVDVMLGIIMKYYLVIKKERRMLHCGWRMNLQSLRWVKEASHKRPPVTVFHLYEMSRIEQPIASEQIRLCWEVGVYGDLGGNEEWLLLGKGFFLITVPF